MKNFKFIILVIMMLSFFSCDNIYYGKKEPESDINGKKENTDTAVTNSAETEILKNITGCRYYHRKSGRYPF